MAAGDIVQIKEGTSTLKDVSFSFDTAPTNGNDIVLFVAGASYMQTTGSGWSEYTGMRVASPAWLGMNCWYRKQSGSGNSFSYSLDSAANSSWIAIEYEGGASSPFDTGAGQHTNTGAGGYTTPSITPAAGDVLLLGAIAAQRPSADMSGDTTGWTNSFTHLASSGPVSATGDRPSVSVGYRVVTANGSTSYSTGASWPFNAPDSMAGQIIAFKLEASSGPQGLTQASRFDNSNNFYVGSAKGQNGVSQGSRFDSSNTFYSATASAVYTLSQAARFDNTSSFYAGTVAPGAVSLAQSARFDNSQNFPFGSISTGFSLAQNTRFDNTNGFYSGTLTIGPATLAQTARFDNSQVFYSGIVSSGEIILVGELFANQNQFFAGALTSKNDLNQNSRFDSSNTFYGGSLAAKYTLSGALFENGSAFYGGVISTDTQSLVAALFENENSFYPGLITTGAVAIVQTETFANVPMFFQGRIYRIGYNDIQTGNSAWVNVSADTDIWSDVVAGSDRDWKDVS